MRRLRLAPTHPAKVDFLEHAAGCVCWGRGGGVMMVGGAHLVPHRADLTSSAADASHPDMRASRTCRLAKLMGNRDGAARSHAASDVTLCARTRGDDNTCGMAMAAPAWTRAVPVAQTTTGL